MSDSFREPKVTINRVYTRQGDQGQTRLVGGQLRPKDDPRVECYGTVDELNAELGAARLACLATQQDALAQALLFEQHALFNLGSLLATLPEDVGSAQPRTRTEDIERLERSIDQHNDSLPTLRSFVLPGGNAAGVALHRARTICRRAERLVVSLARQEPVDELAIAYLNRLSDALFVWSRAAVSGTGDQEVLWQPNLI